MQSSIQDLNLARKWRPQTFDTIVGQDIPVKMLKNSLYLKKFFPVYLFAGQRGCGKTTTARVLAAAVNCSALELFQQSPATNALPCLTCQSCLSMLKGNHPDFIEIDAASNTGVDNIRQLIETASYVPLAGSKKVFLIDEAHMLSKAAFNAFLKILEEPPRSVMFILATTELHKIPQTVLSRCFQVVFSAIDANPLRTHLASICASENIVIEPKALDAIIQETDGSARDAINLLEQVRFAHDTITADTILKTLGKLSNDVVIRLFEYIVDKKPRELLLLLSSIAFEQVNAETLWQTLSEYCKALLWLKYDCPAIPAHLEPFKERLAILTERCSLNRLQAIMQLLWHQEALFLRTHKKHAFLETVLIQLASQANIVDLEELIKQVSNEPKNSPVAPRSVTSTPKTSPAITQTTTPVARPTEQATQCESKAEFLEPANDAPAKQAPLSPYHEQWQRFKDDLVAAALDPIVTSILSQAHFIGLSDTKAALVLRLSNNSKFFKDNIESGRLSWQPLLIKNFPGTNTFEFIAGTEEQQSGSRGRIPPRPQSDITPTPHKAKSSESAIAPTPAMNNPADWPIASLVKKYLPGKIKKSHLLN